MFEILQKSQSIEVKLHKKKKLLFIYSLVKDGFEQMKPDGLDKDHTSLYIVNWCYRIGNKDLHQITDTA